MNSDPVIEEVWKTKEKISRQAGGDFQQLAEYIEREWAKNPTQGQRVSVDKKKEGA